MKNILIIIFLPFLIQQPRLQAQDMVFEKIAGKEVRGSIIEVDNLGHIYIISEGTLKKFDGEGALLYTYTELMDGKIQSADVGDPLKIMIFNPDFGKIKFLDNKLSLKKDFIVLSDLGYPNASLTAGSYENGFWLFDPLGNQVIRFDNNLRQTHNSGNIANITGFEINPVFMTEADNTLYLCDPANGILVFDRYATYIRLLPIKNLRSFQVFSQQIIYPEGGKLKTFDLKTFEEKTILFPETDEIVNAIWSNDRIYVLTGTHLNIYKIR